MINGHLSEAHQGFAVLEDVDKDTFVRFLRWVYTKDYPDKEHTVVKDEVAAEQASQNGPPLDFNDDDWAVWGNSKKKKKKKGETEKASLKETFVRRQYDWDDVPLGPVPTRSNKGPEEDYSEVFLCHARIYVFAEKYDIQHLKVLALRKLQQVLAIFTLYQERVGDVLSLLQYVYANTTESKTGVEDVRTMLAHYIGCEMETLMKDGQIKDLLSEHDEMLNDFLTMFAQRIS